MRVLRRLFGVVAVIAAASALLAAADSASAHPLGNFSINHLSTVSVSADHVDVRYVLDQAEIPTVQERSLGPAGRARQEARRGRRGGWCCSSTAAASRSSRPGQAQLSFPDGAGGLKTTRVELPLRAVVDHPHRVELRDGTFPGRIGWKAIVSAPGQGTAVRSDAPTGDPTDGLRRYPAGPAVEPARPPRRELLGRARRRHAGGAQGRARRNGRRRARQSDGFAGLFADAASGQGVLLLLLLAAFGWGALHALSPGHGKAMVAAYLVGTRGSARHAIALGATVTVTHTIGVFALGVVTLALSQYVLPEDLYPWLTLTSGLLVVVDRRGRAALAGSQGAARPRARSPPRARPRPRPSPRPRPELEGAAGHGGGRRPDPLPVRPRRAAGRDLAARSGPRTAADHGLQPRPRRDPHGTRPGRRLRPQVDPAAPRGGPACGRSARGVGALIVGVGCVLTAKAVPGWSDDPMEDSR